MILNRTELVNELMEIRKAWTLPDFKEAYGDGEWDVIPESIQECRDQMENHIFHTYDPEYIQECIENEKK